MSKEARTWSTSVTGTVATSLISWPLHDIVIANIVWCMAYTREVGGGVLYCPIAVQ